MTTFFDIHPGAPSGFRPEDIKPKLMYKHPHVILRRYFAGKISKNAAIQQFNLLQGNDPIDNAGKNWLRWNIQQRNPDIANRVTSFDELPEKWTDKSPPPVRDLEKEIAEEETGALTVTPGLLGRTHKIDPHPGSPISYEEQLMLKNIDDTYEDPSGFDTEDVFKDFKDPYTGEDWQPYQGEMIARDRYRRSIDAKVQNREITPFQGDYLEGQFNNLFGRFRLFAKPFSDDPAYSESFMDFLKGDVPSTTETYTRARDIGEYLSTGKVPTNLLNRDDFDPQSWRQFFGPGTGETTRSLVMDAALAGVHPLFKEGRKRALESLFAELGGAEAELEQLGREKDIEAGSPSFTIPGDPGIYPFLTRAVERGYFGTPSGIPPHVGR
jgi:hypothetical protein